MIEQGQAEPDDVQKLIDNEEAVWVRIAATRKDDEWQESLMEVTSGVAPDRWTVQRWEYDEARAAPRGVAQTSSESQQSAQ